MAELERVIKDFRCPTKVPHSPSYWCRDQNKLYNELYGSVEVPHTGELYRDMYSAATKYKPLNIPKTRIVRVKILETIHANLRNIFNRAMEECGVRKLVYRSSSKKYHSRIDMGHANYSCVFQTDPSQFYWGINHGVFTDDQDAALLRARSAALLQAVTTENAQTHIREGLGLEASYKMEDLLKKACSPEFEFLETYAVGISMCNPAYAHLITVNAGIMRGTGYNQFALFHPPKVLSKHCFFQGGRHVWCALSRETRKTYLHMVLRSFRLEMIEPLFPLLHFMFNWKHGLAESLIRNRDVIVEVRTGPLLDVIVQDDHGMFFDNYGHIQLDCGLQPPSKRVEFARREVFVAHLIQHGWLLLRKAFLDTLLFGFLNCVHEQHSQKVLLSLTSSSQRKKKGRKKPPTKKKKPSAQKEVSKPFTQTILSTERLEELNKLIYVNHGFSLDLFAKWRKELLSKPHRI